jgi:hypothetical protein
MRGVRQSPVRLSLMASVLLLLTTAGWSQQPSLRWLGTLGGSGSDGLLAFQPMAPWWSAGLRNAAGYERAFRWTAAGGMQDLGTLGGNKSGLMVFPPMVSVVVGWAENGTGRQRRAFRWTASGGMQVSWYITPVIQSARGLPVSPPMVLW